MLLNAIPKFHFELKIEKFFSFQIAILIFDASFEFLGPSNPGEKYSLYTFLKSSWKDKVFTLIKKTIC